jgi:hypothetical protein
MGTMAPIRQPTLLPQGEAVAGVAARSLVKLALYLSIGPFELFCVLLFFLD